MHAHRIVPDLNVIPRLIIGLLLAFSLCAGNVAAGAEPVAPKAPVVDPFPLRPPDTSSPRDTLKSFLLHAEFAINAWLKTGTLDARGLRNAVDAIETLDVSTTAGGELLSVQIERVLLLKEILDRIELPPLGNIPGDTEVAAGSVSGWTVPQTRITIARADAGPHKGEFLFSAATVERLGEFYRRAKDLPYKPKATTPGIYEAYVAAGSSGGGIEEPLRNRLKKVDASSPRATLLGFFDSINIAYDLATKTDAKLKADPAQLTDEQVRETEARARTALRRATNLLDLSRLPEAFRQDSAVGAALQLKEVLDRTRLPFLETVPDVRMVEAARKRAQGLGMPAGEGYRWRYPNTEIDIVEVTKGERAGQFLFSAETVRRAGEFYAKVRDLPYRSDRSAQGRNPYEWAGESKGAYLRYITEPGYIVPEAHLLGRLVNHLPPSFKTLYGQQTLWKWIGLLITIVVTAAAGVLVFSITQRIAQRLRRSARSWVMLLAPILAALLVRRAFAFIDLDLNITGYVLRLMVTLGQSTVAILVVWAVFRLAQAISETLIASPAIREGSHDASLVRIGARIVAVVAGGTIIIYSLQNLGADMVPLLAGLGVGGLAIALAAQRTFANFIGSLILFVNKPVRVGDFCRYGDQIGTVEHMGLLATRIRSLERTIVTVPNAEFSEMKIDNFAVRDQRLLKTVLQLRYETTSEQMRYILAKLRELLLGHPKVTPSPARARFVGYGAYSKDVEVFAYLDTADHDTFLAIQEDVLLRMERIVEEAGSGFAFPSQTAYFARDKGVDTERGSAAQAEVESWRKGGRLPFPEFGGDERRKLEDVLDYPPKGSPDYVPPKRAAVTGAQAGVAVFSKDDLPDLPGLAAKLRGADRVAEYLRTRFCEETRSLLAKYGGGRDLELRDALVRDLNEVVLGPSLYDEKRFSEVNLRPQTRELALARPEGEELARLNRLLLEDVFSRELGIKSESA